MGFSTATVMSALIFSLLRYASPEVAPSCSATFGEHPQKGGSTLARDLLMDVPSQDRVMFQEKSLSEKKGWWMKDFSQTVPNCRIENRRSQFLMTRRRGCQEEENINL